MEWCPTRSLVTPLLLSVFYSIYIVEWGVEKHTILSQNTIKHLWSEQFFMQTNGKKNALYELWLHCFIFCVCCKTTDIVNMTMHENAQSKKYWHTVLTYSNDLCSGVHSPVREWHPNVYVHFNRNFCLSIFVGPGCFTNMWIGICGRISLKKNLQKYLATLRAISK